MDDKTFMPFGKHRGTPMESVPDGYLVWCYGQDFIRERFPELYQYIVDNAHLLDDLILRKEDRK